MERCWRFKRLIERFGSVHGEILEGFFHVVFISAFFEVGIDRE
jgi:hypothetical protein